MKDWWKNGAVILLVIGVLYIIFLRECKRPLPCPGENEVIVSQSVWDSIMALANKPPIVKIDTHYIQGPIVYVDRPVPIPTPDPKDTTINHYSDSLIQSDINVWVDFSVRGRLLYRQWTYRPITTVITKDSTIFVPKIVEVEKIVIQPQNGLYAYGMAGGNSNTFLFGGGLDYITRKDTEIGYMYQRYGNENFHSFKLGARLFRRR